jgi:hypothetical protein
MKSVWTSSNPARATWQQVRYLSIDTEGAIGARNPFWSSFCQCFNKCDSN